MTESRVLTPISTFIDLNCYLKFKKNIYKLKKKKTFICINDWFLKFSLCTILDIEI